MTHTCLSYHGQLRVALRIKWTPTAPALTKIVTFSEHEEPHYLFNQYTDPLHCSIYLAHKDYQKAENTQ